MNVGDEWKPPTFPEAPECKMRISWQVSTLCSLRCFYCDFYDKVTHLPPRIWTEQDAERAWDRAFRRWGKCLIDVNGLEPMLEFPMLMIPASMGHVMEASSNLTAHPDRLRDHPGDIHVAASFHPIAWGYEIDRFIDQYRAYEDAGFRMMGASIVGHPVFLSLIPGWRDRFASESIYFYVHPFRGEYDDRIFPSGYDENEWEIILGNDTANNVSADGDTIGNSGLCAAGTNSFLIFFNGQVWRCPMDEKIGNVKKNFFFDDDIELNPYPQPCSKMDQCFCEALYVYRLP